MRKIQIFLLSVFVLLFVVSCTPGNLEISETQEKDSGDFTVSDTDNIAIANRTVVDSAGNEVVLPDVIQRAVVCSASNVGLLCEMGGESILVGVDEISKEMESLGEEIPALDLENIDVNAVIALQPDVFITSYRYTVLSCEETEYEGEVAESIETVNEDVYKVLQDAGIPVVYIEEPTNFATLQSNVDLLGTVFNKKVEAMLLKDKLSVALLGLKDVVKSDCRVYIEIESLPEMRSAGSDSFIGKVVELCGGVNILGGVYPTISEEVIIALNPEVIFIVSETDDIEAIRARKEWATIDAVKNDRIYVLEKSKALGGDTSVIDLIEIIRSAIQEE